MFILQFLRMILVALDQAAYGLVDILYRLFMKLSETGIFSAADINSFATRIYFFLGLAMLFKISISIVNYIMNPDLVKDNKVGGGKLLKNIIIVLVGIVTVPYIFEAAFSLQRIVLRDGVIPNLILGTKYSAGDEAANDIANAGNNMQFTTYTALVHLNEDYFTQECYIAPIDLESGDWSKACTDSNGGQFLGQLGKYQNSIRAAYQERAMYKFLTSGAIVATFKNNGEEYFFFDYMYLVTTAAGLFLAYILLLFCFDVAVRSVKLGFLQLIAPIPLIAKIDPKKGDEVFNKWVKECISTYLSLFGRLIAIYFAIFLISSVSSAYYITETDPSKMAVRDPFVHVFIIFGTLLFVKDLPKLIETLTGIKVSGDLDINKKLRSVPLLGKPTAEGLALGGRSIGNVFKGLKKDENGNRQMGKAWEAIKNDAANYRHGMFAAGKQTLGMNDRQLDRLEMEKGRLLKQTQEANTFISKRKALADSISKMEDRAWTQITTGQAKAVDASGVNLSDRYRELQAALKVAEAGTGGVVDQKAVVAAQKAIDNFKQGAIDAYMANSVVGDDKTFDNLYADYQQQCGFAGVAEANRSVIGSIHQLFGTTKGEISETSRDIGEVNQRLDEIKREQEQIQEDIKASKPYYTTKR